MRRLPALLAAAAVCLTLTGCPPIATLRMQARLDPLDTSSVSPKLAKRKFEKVMVIPPSGSARGEFDAQISMIERQFLKKGITLINSAITGRVVKDITMNDKGEKKQEGAQGLSDAERALVMAKETGADALLQIGRMGWSNEATTTRYFVMSSADAYREVTLEQYQSFEGPKQAFYSPWFTFVGRLTDVQTGEVMASLQIEGAANWNLPSDYVAELTGGQITSENYSYASVSYDMSGSHSTLGDWLQTSSDRTIERVIGKLADIIVIQ